MKILVILASFNGEKYILDQINSILNQSSVDIQLMIYDDCSSDNTIDIIKEINDPRIILNQNIEPTGSAALNFLFAIKSITNFCLYDFIAFADQDDIWLSNKIFDASLLLLKNNASLYCSNLTLWDEDKNEKFLLRKDYPQKQFDYLFEGGSAGCTYVLKIDLLIHFKNEISNIDLLSWPNLSHDWLIYFFARINKYKVFIDSNPKIIYRIHNNNVHGQLNKNSLSSYIKRFKYVFSGWYFNHLNHFNKLTPNGSQMQYIYDSYTKNWFTRFFILMKFNVKLIRNNKKFIQFAIVSLIPRKKLK
jgi:rhamnosyltransferase